MNVYIMLWRIVAKLIWATQTNIYCCLSIAIRGSSYGIGSRFVYRYNHVEQNQRKLTIYIAWNVFLPLFCLNFLRTNANKRVHTHTAKWLYLLSWIWGNVYIWVRLFLKINKSHCGIHDYYLEHYFVHAVEAFWLDIANNVQLPVGF